MSVALDKIVVESEKMAERKVQHYVPKYVFRNFNGGADRICVLLKKDGSVIENASIKGQASSDWLYGPAHVEKDLAELDGKHAQVFKSLIRMGMTGNAGHWNEFDLPFLLQGLMLQRSRTPLSVEKMDAAMEEAVTARVKERLLSENSLTGQFMLAEVDKVAEDFRGDIGRKLGCHIAVALRNAFLLLDLKATLIKNETDNPFIFGDSPVVFYNSYCRNVTDVGVLGAQTPGLQIIYPLSPQVLLMLFDPKKYQGKRLMDPMIMTDDPSDIFHLNAMQWHHSQYAIYFGNIRDEAYVRSQFALHRPRMESAHPGFERRIQPGGLVNHFERQIPYPLTLSFMHCTPIAVQNYRVRIRSSELVDEVNHRRIARGYKPIEVER